MELKFMVLELKVRGRGWAILGEELLCQQGGAVQLCSGPSRHRHRRPCPSARKTGKDRKGKGQKEGKKEEKRGNKEKRGRKGVRIIPILFLWPSFHAAKWLPLL